MQGDERAWSVVALPGLCWDAGDGSAREVEHRALTPAPSTRARVVREFFCPPWILLHVPQPPGSQQGSRGTESCRRDILAFVEVFAQRFVTCLCQCQTRRGALGTPLTLTPMSRMFPSCTPNSPLLPHPWNPLLPPVLHPSLHCRVLGTSEMGLDVTQPPWGAPQ